MPPYPIMIQCPECAIRLKVESAPRDSRIRCPACAREMQLVRVEHSNRETTPFEDLPAPLLLSEPVLRPQPRFWTSCKRTISGAWTRNKQTVKQGLIAGALLVTTAAIGAGLYYSREKLPLESMEVLLPGHDSPEMVLEQYVNTADAMVHQMSAIADVKSRDRTIPILRRLVERCQSLIARAAAIGPRSEQEFSLLDQWFTNRLPTQSLRVAETARAVHAQRRLNSTKLNSVLFDLTSITKQFGPAVELAWRTIPPPTSEAQKLAHQITMNEYRVWCAAASVSSEDQYRKLGAIVASAASELESTLVKQVASADDKIAIDSSPFSRSKDQLTADLELRFDALRSKYGASRDGFVFERYCDALTALGNLQQAGDSKRDNGSVLMTLP